MNRQTLCFFQKHYARKFIFSSLQIDTIKSFCRRALTTTYFESKQDCLGQLLILENQLAVQTQNSYTFPSDRHLHINEYVAPSEPQKQSKLESTWIKTTKKALAKLLHFKIFPLQTSTSSRFSWQFEEQRCQRKERDGKKIVVQPNCTQKT